MIRFRRAGQAAVVGLVLALVVGACTPPPPTPSADWQMYARNSGGYFASCTATPGPYLIPVSNGTTSGSQVTESVDGVNEHVYRFSKGHGFSIPTTGEAPNDAYSIVLLFRLSDLAGYRRLVDVKNSTVDSGLYLYAGHLRFYPDSVSGARLVGTDEWVQVVFSRTAGGSVRGYVDGTQQWQFTDTTGNALVSPDNRIIVFLDNLAGPGQDEESAGAVARIRLFDHALSATEISNLGQTPGSPCT